MIVKILNKKSIATFRECEAELASRELPGAREESLRHTLAAQHRSWFHAQNGVLGRALNEWEAPLDAELRTILMVAI